ncbi:hypothetical protein EC991_009850 [Linnemannia zychae]|nr:hypothetical protein EC991_009850 [Linnemannia zychae]
MQILRGTVGKAPPYSTQDHRDHGQLQQPEEKEGAKKAVLEDKQDQEQLRQPEEKLVSWSGRCAKQVALKDENPQEQRRQSEQQMSKLEHEVISLKTRLKELEGQVSQSRRLCEIEDRLLIVRMEQKRLGLEEKQLEKEQQQLQLCLGQSGQLAEGAKDWMTYLTL